MGSHRKRNYEQKIQVNLPPVLYSRVETYMAEKGIEHYAEAVRQLLELGLAADDGLVDPYPKIKHVGMQRTPPTKG